LACDQHVTLVLGVHNVCVLCGDVLNDDKISLCDNNCLNE